MCPKVTAVGGSGLLARHSQRPSMKDTLLSEPEVCSMADVRAPLGVMRLAVAATEPSRERGLMNAAFLPAGEGMLFIYPGGDQYLEFWTKDMLMPLDIVFLRADGTIGAVAANVPATEPGTPDDQAVRRSGIGRCVIELGAGEAARFGLVPGLRLVLPQIEPI
jgi:uncharacterized membrane protein (UPF0127 family)